jgi:predicted SnoaL-like aldol condensation-catalyzing enzyme
MLKKMLLIVVGVIALATTSTARDGASVESSGQFESAMIKNNRQIVEEFLDLINRHRRVREAFERYVSENYVQHNPTAGDGREDAIRLIEGLAATPGFNPMVKRIVAEGDLVAVHMHVQLGDGPGLAVMDMFRLDKGKIVEHWDVIQEVPKQTRSGNSMF